MTEIDLKLCVLKDSLRTYEKLMGMKFSETVLNSWRIQTLNEISRYE